MKILSLNQIKKIDQYCIDNEDISSIELVERSAKSCFNWIIHHYRNIQKVILLAGNGKNGGDGLSLARMLSQYGTVITVYILNISNHFSPEFIINKNKILKYGGIELKNIYKGENFPILDNKNSLLIDAIFGTGLNRPIKKYWKSFFHYINENKFIPVISIDLPSGLFMEKNQKDFEGIIKATHTLTFQSPKLPFFLSDYAKYIGKWHLLNIGWKDSYSNEMCVKNFYVDDIFIKSIYKKRKKFSHKGNYGHGLLVGGYYGMIGSMALSAKASFRIGIGKLSVYVPRCGYQILQILIPEAIIKTDSKDKFISNIPTNIHVNAIGIGMGMGEKTITAYALESFFLKNKENKIPMVIDADAINILSNQLKIMNSIPEKTILTPHPKEFRRLCGPWKDDYQKLDLLKNFSKKYKIYIVLKGAHTVISTPNGNLYFNSTGNPGMSTAGSGDVLTGIITGLLAQGYSPKKSCIMGVYLHGLAGDIASIEKNEESIIAEDIINYIGKSYQKMKMYKKE
ncbi:bifunctional ADP-dependent NAD(P)H-hydrate dehydratase/NAD(P)H-hydrate epimerase [Blattabacterium sp. (Cryptocercus kyebangensis)]|uniref:NAD(P)H-hydrate dehydratase n=1 Tax=Blattabacterium sp. (Cryptocercus kyebangensis) TaxID=298656 RepID=UPI000D7C948F|nr:NAD(P)H-hydrate dehydratase [Blattabacterium sp. (Cryptocercus kyebangensis)]AWU43490.1 bifunctional ADP-dependent NAD(P)H-hydrate dehydratase/NAD(P)H-hydrate epimerase [Blattabacterium sp. (Cryptocercus kyebangensis)]